VEVDFRERQRKYLRISTFTFGARARVYKKSKELEEKEAQEALKTIKLDNKLSENSNNNTSSGGGESICCGSSNS